MALKDEETTQRLARELAHRVAACLSLPAAPASAQALPQALSFSGGTSKTCTPKSAAMPYVADDSPCSVETLFATAAGCRSVSPLGRHNSVGGCSSGCCGSGSCSGAERPPLARSCSMFSSAASGSVGLPPMQSRPNGAIEVRWAVACPSKANVNKLLNVCYLCTQANVLQSHVW